MVLATQEVLPKWQPLSLGFPPLYCGNPQDSVLRRRHGDWEVSTLAR